MKFKILTLVLLISFGLNAQIIERVEPPNWWTGMQHSEIQILVYGEKIADLQPSIQNEAVALKRVVRVENPNYLFLNISIDENARPQVVPIEFFKGENLLHKYDFELKKRIEGRAEIEGFNGSDVMYLITPDRFANGDPDNDNVDGMKELADRKFKGGRHGGDIKGISDNLDYIAGLGFTAIWLNPVVENDMKKWSYHGYAGTDFYKIDPRYGSNEEYKLFCEEANKKGIKVIMDMIMNHSGSEHWFVLDPPTSDWINFQEGFRPTSHRRTTVQDIHASEYDKKAFSDGWFVNTMPDLNQRNDLMATYLIQNTIWWIEYAGLSGIRMDTYPYPDKDFMTDWTCAVMKEYPGFNVVGEEWSLNPAIVSYWQRGKLNHDGYTSCLRSLMDFPLQDAVVTGLRAKENWNTGLIKLYEALANDFLYADSDELVVFPDNHDMARFFTQVNNDFDLFKMGMVYFSTIRGVPQFYYGTEILMDSNEDPGDHGIIRSDFPGGWEGDGVNGFTGEGLSKQQQNAQDFTRKLLNWRKSKTVIHNGKLIQFAPEKGVYSYFRFNGKDIVMVVFNKNETTVELGLKKFDELLHGRKSAYDVLNDRVLKLNGSISLPAKSALILEIN